MDSWDAIEADFAERVDRLTLLELVRRIHDQRMLEARRADVALRTAVAAADKARKALDESTALLEDAGKLVQRWR